MVEAVGLIKTPLTSAWSGRWGCLPPIWNKQFAIDLFADWRCSPYEEEEFLQARRGPAVIHYCTQTKPWHTFCDHPLQAVLDFRDHLRQTSLGDGIPDDASLLRRLLEYIEGPHRQLLDTDGYCSPSPQKETCLESHAAEYASFASARSLVAVYRSTRYSLETNRPPDEMMVTAFCTGTVVSDYRGGEEKSWNDLRETLAALAHQVSKNQPSSYCLGIRAILSACLQICRMLSPGFASSAATRKVLTR